MSGGSSSGFVGSLSWVGDNVGGGAGGGGAGGGWDITGVAWLAVSSLVATGLVFSAFLVELEHVGWLSWGTWSWSSFHNFVAFFNVKVLEIGTWALNVQVLEIALVMGTGRADGVSAVLGVEFSDGHSGE